MGESVELSKLIKTNGRIIEFNIENVNCTILSEVKDLILSNISYGDIIWPSSLPNDTKSIVLIEEIENLLKQNNNNYTRFSSDFIHGILSYHVYGEINEGDSPFDKQDHFNNKIEKIIKKSKYENKESHRNRWKIIKVFSLDKVYQSALYFNEYMGHLILAHKGIESKIENIFKEDSSLNNQIKSVICKEYVPQLLKCYEVTEFCYKTAIEKKCTLSFTGYSNGAWLSEYSIYFCEKYIKPMFKNDFNVKLKAVLFESPGILRDENQSFLNIISSEIEFDLRNLNIVNYLISPNLMNSCNKHIGKVYRLFIKNKDKEHEKSKEFFEKIKKIKLIGYLLSDTMEKSRFIFNGLYYTFDHSVLRLILEECFENEKPKTYCQMQNWPLVKIDFDKDYKDNFKKYLTKPISFFTKFLPENLSILSEPIKLITSNLGQYFAEKSCPGIVILFNVLIELTKGNINLDFLNNELFYTDAESIEKITFDQGYIKNKYEKNKKISKQEKKIQELIEKKIENKFSLFYSSNYMPLIISEKSKILKISNDYDQNIDWCFYKLFFNELNESNFNSKIIYQQILDLKTKYEVSSFHNQEHNVYLIQKLDENIDFERLKEFFLRLISISRQDLKSIISTKDEQKVLVYGHNLGERIKYTSRGNKIKKIESKFKKYNCVLLYGPPGIGKTTIAKEFGFEKVLEKSNVRIFNSEKKLVLQNEYKSFVSNILNIKYSGSNLDELIDIANSIMLKSNVKTFFIFDNVENFEYIRPLITGLLQSKNIRILITGRNENIIDKIKLKKIKIDFFNTEEAYHFIKENDQNKFDKNDYDIILSALQYNSEINPKELEVAIKYLNKNYFFDENAIKNIINSKKAIFEYVFVTLMDERHLLESISYLNPDKISIQVLKKIVKHAEIEHIERLEKYGLIELNRKERSISIHRIVRKDIHKYFKNESIDNIIASIVNSLENKDVLELDEYFEHLSTINEENNKEIVDLNDTRLKMKKNLQIYYEKKNYLEFLIQISEEIYKIFSSLKKEEDKELAQAIFDYANSLKFLSKYEKAREYYLEAYEMRKRLYNNQDHSDIAQSLNSLAVIYGRLGDSQKALEYDMQAYEMRKRVHNNQDHSDIASSLHSLAVCLESLGDDQKALDYNLQSYEMRKRLYKDVDHCDIAESLNGLSVSYEKIGDDHKSLEYANQAYEMQKRLFKGADHFDIAQSLNSLAVSFERLGDDKKALEYYLKSYEMRKRLFKGADHSHIAFSLNSLASGYSRLGKDGKALKLIIKAYEMQKRIYKDIDHSDIALSLNNLAACYGKLGDEHKAFENYYDSYQMRKRLNKNADHFDIAVSLSNLAISYSRLGDDQKALDYNLQAYEMQMRLYLDKDHFIKARSLNSLALIYSRLADDHKALECNLKAYEMLKRLYQDADHPQTAQSLNNLILIYSRLGDTIKVKEYSFIAYEMRKRLYKDADHPEIAESLNSLAICFEKLGEDNKAKEYLEQAFEMRKRMYKDSDHYDIAQSLYFLAVNYSRLGDEQKAKEYYLEAYEMQKRLFKNADHLDLAQLLYCLAVTYLRLGENQKALENNLQACEMRKRLFKDEDNFSISESLNNIAVCFENLGDNHKANQYYLEAYEMRKRLYKSADHLDIAFSLSNLAVSYTRLNQEHKALEYNLQAYEMQKRLYNNQDHSDLVESLNNLALNYQRLGDEQKALHYKLQANEMQTRLSK